MARYGERQQRLQPSHLFPSSVGEWPLLSPCTQSFVAAANVLKCIQTKEASDFCSKACQASQNC